MALGFRDSEALQVVLRSGLCPPEVLSQSAQIARAGDGGVILEPEKALSSSALAKLRAAGVVTDARLPSDAREVRCWAEALPLQRTGVAEIPSLVLLVTERATELVDLAAELVRLGCDRQELLVAGPSWSEPANAAERGPFGVARVVDPPTYTIVRALDREHGLRVYGPDPSGQELVWTELGYHHPLAEQLRTEAGTLLLVDRDGWRVIPNASWAAVDAALELRVPGDDTELPSGPLPAKRQIELRLAGGRREVPSLWVIRKNGLAVIDRLLDYLPEEIVARLTFAATTGPESPS
ncbi:MAG: hypothetical protein JWO36_1708, partial [Myxococcales bacterium]|nr:hypothetical protein [Myxococcales bacterium]